MECHETNRRYAYDPDMDMLVDLDTGNVYKWDEKSERWRSTGAGQLIQTLSSDLENKRWTA